MNRLSLTGCFIAGRPPGLTREESHAVPEKPGIRSHATTTLRLFNTLG
jgi:hypothetical protein